MIVEHGVDKSGFGTGVCITLNGNEVATAIDAWLVAQGVAVRGPRTIKVNGDLCQTGSIYVDPSGLVNYGEISYSGRGPIPGYNQGVMHIPTLGYKR